MKKNYKIFEKLRNKKYLSILLLFIFVTGIFAVTSSNQINSPGSNISKYNESNKNDTSKQSAPSGSTNVKTISEGLKRVQEENKLRIQEMQDELNRTKNMTSLPYYDQYYSDDLDAELSKGTPMPTATPKPLPYPRISINYSLERSTSIRGDNADQGYTFLTVTLDIRNYGYKYFDAHPTKFRIGKGDNIILPSVNVSTGNMIDVIIPNNSRAKGDLIFLMTTRRAASNQRIYYTNKDYKILYQLISPEDMNN